jgi:hypothetical protein
LILAKSRSVIAMIGRRRYADKGVTKAIHMRTTWRCFVSTTLIVVANGGLASAQVPLDYPVVGVAAPGDCDHAPDIWEIGGYFATPGVYEFWIYPILKESINGSRFGVSWEPEWTLLEAELCYGELVQGNLESPSLEGLTLSFPPNPEPENHAAIRYRIDASTDGFFRLIHHGFTGDMAYQLPDGTWQQYYGGWSSDFFYVMIGEQDRCSNIGPIYRPANWCDLVRASRHSPGSIDLPGTIMLPAASTFVDTLSALAASCYIPPECGQPYSYYCDITPHADAEWLTFESLDWNQRNVRIRMTVDTHGLALGSYSSPVMVDGGCGNCGVLCTNVTLIVEPVAVRASSWGQLKARYRD